MKTTASASTSSTTCAGNAQLRFLAQILFAEDAFELFGAPEHEERHQDNDQHDTTPMGMPKTWSSVRRP